MKLKLWLRKEKAELEAEMDAIPAKGQPAKHNPGLRAYKSVQPARSSYEDGISHYLLSRISVSSRPVLHKFACFPRIGRLMPQ